MLRFVHRRPVRLTCVVFVSALAWFLPWCAAADDFFRDQVEPLFQKRCYSCHSHEQELLGGLALDSRSGWVKGGESGPAVVPGKPADSRLIRAVRRVDAELQMPPDEPLPESEVATLIEWVRRGAPDPRIAEASPEEAWKKKLAERSTWWSLQAPRFHEPPQVEHPDWRQEPVDRFVYSKLVKAGLTPARPAELAVLVRRLSFVLTGLPPSAHSSLAGISSYEAAVDALLASEHFGERFARHWMDVVRYTDTYGYEWDIAVKGGWEYRDYLIRAFNEDVGFDQLVREQIAGDLLASPRINAQQEINESLIGPLFYHMGEHRHGSSLDFNGIHQEMIDNKIDVFSKAFLGMTVACARCHDHKLDAISQADYYALAGVFMTPRWVPRVIDTPEKNQASLAELKKLHDEIRRELSGSWRSTAAAWTGADWRAWAQQNEKALSSTKLGDVAYPLAKLIAAGTMAEHSAAEKATAAGATASDAGANPVPEAAADMVLADAWKGMAEEWRTTRETRRQANTAFSSVSDFSQPGFPAGWTVEGDGLLHGYVDEGTPLIRLEGETLIASLLPRGYHTHALSSKLPGAIALPAPEKLPQPWISLEMAGGEWAGKNVIPQNAFMNEGNGGPTFFDPGGGRQWLSVSATPLKNGVTRVLTEFATTALNPNFPPRTGLARAGKVTLPANDDGFDKRSWFSLTGVVAHSAAGSPADELDTFTSLFTRAAASSAASEFPATEQAAWEVVARWFSGAVERWGTGACTAGDVKLLNWLLEQKRLPNEATALPQVAPLVQRYREVEEAIAFPRTVNSMDERNVTPLEYRLNLRGNVDEEGPAIARDFLEVFHGKHRVRDAAGSGRLELAEYLSSRDHPQTARVYVNRVWQWVFGTGLVDTPNDFGKLGGRPSHPELLDWLACQFMEEGWSTKKLVRRLVLSQTFRQGGEVSEIGRDRDPANRLWHHYPTRRLEAEAIRDSLLAVSGRLDPRLYGRPIRPARPAEDAAKRLYSGPLDGLGRRSVYIEMSIMAPPTFLIGFNLPEPKLSTGKRDVTNVPGQALILLNDPFVQAMAQHWSERLVADGQSSVDARLRMMFRAALGRDPDEDELQRWRQAATTFASSDQVLPDRQAWTAVALALFNTKEFLYYR